MFRAVLLASTVAILASGALAQTSPAPAMPASPAAPSSPAAPTTVADGHLASNLIGEDVYNSTADDAESIGEVNDIVIDNAGMVSQLVVGVGGFLGIGEKNVAVPFNDAKWAERDGDRWLVVTTTKEALNALPSFDTSIYDPAPVVRSPTPPTTTAPGTTPPPTAVPPASTTPAEPPRPAN